MDHRGRRNRRRNHSHPIETTSYPVQGSKPWSLFGGLYSFMIMTSLLALIYFMLEHHCKTCNTKCDLGNITKSIQDISKNLSLMNENYNDLERKIFKFAQDLPKIEGQIDILEALANTVVSKDFRCGPEFLSTPTVAINPHNQPDDNFFNSTAKELKNSLKPTVVNQE